VISDVRALGGFVAIRADGPVDVELKAADGDRVTVRADDNIAPLIDTRIAPGDRPVLEIGVRPGAWLKTSRTPTVIVEFRALEDVSISGSGDLRADRIEARDFALSIAGSGDARIATLEATRFAAVLAGSGDLSVAGHADEQAYRLAGSGDVRAGRLRGRRVIVSIAGSGDASVSASESLEATIRGSGDIVYTGSPRVAARVDGSGRVRRRD
jgi:hypothetical protein